jgi:hypothetical protein
MSVGMGLETRVHCINGVICQTRIVIIIMVTFRVSLYSFGLNEILVVASAYSGHLDLCLYFYCLCFILSCSVVTPLNLVVVVGGVTRRALSVATGIVMSARPLLLCISSDGVLTLLCQSLLCLYISSWTLYCLLLPQSRHSASRGCYLDGGKKN